MPASSYLKGLTWLGQAGFRLSRGGTVVYFDPWEVGAEPHDADILLITHPHFDHLDPESAARVAGPEAVIVTVADCAAKLEQARGRGAALPGTVRVIRPGESVEVKGLRVEAVPAYNTDKEFHKRESGWAGFIVEVEGVRFYHAGDTDRIPEMGGLKADVALLPVSGTYVMTAEQAAGAAKEIGARVTVPMHYGAVVGTAADARRFQALCGGLIVEILEKGVEK